MSRSITKTCLALAAGSLLAAGCATTGGTPPDDTKPASGVPSAAPGAVQKSVGRESPAQRPGSASRAAQAPKAVPAQRSVYYDLDRSDIKPEFRPAIEGHALYLRDHAGARVTIEGNGDERGSREYNLALGQRRAEGVRRMMRLSGAADEQIEAVSLGEEKPKALGHDEASWAENRRSDFVYRRGD